MGRVLFHIGMPKTGTTAIQRTLASNDRELSRQGVLYPTTGRFWSCHHPFAWSASIDRLPNQVPEAVPAGIIRPLEEMLEDVSQEVGRDQTVVFSSEALFHVSGSEMRRLTDWAAAHAEHVALIVYVRPPAAHHEQWYRQVVKRGTESRSFSQYLAESPTTDALSRLDELQGGADMTVLPYLRHMFPADDVVRHFCEVVGIDPTPLAALEHEPNRTLDAEATELKLWLNQQGLGRAPQLEDALEAWSVARRADDRSLFSPQDWARFQAQTAPRHQELVDRYRLPPELKDERPIRFTEVPLSQRRLDELLAEFLAGYPDLTGLVRPEAI